MVEVSERPALGRSGEDIATAWLVERGWSIIMRNWRCAVGEVDIVATDPTGVLVFCEVKCRSGLGYGDPLEAITRAKVAKLRQLVSAWFANGGRHAGPVRIDAIGVLRRRGYAPVVTHVAGIGA